MRGLEKNEEDVLSVARCLISPCLSWRESRVRRSNGPDVIEMVQGSSGGSRG